MAGERRKRQQRVRHEAGGSTSATSSVPDNQQNDAPPTPSPTQPNSAAAAPAPSSTAAVANGKPTTKRGGISGTQGTGGGGRGGRGGGKRGVAVATVDEAKYYQPVTIMESKEGSKTDGLEELDEAPRKYKRRGIVSNWSRYDETPPGLEELEDGRDYLIGEDFSAVLQAQSLGSGGSGGHLQLKGEERWGAGVGGEGLQGLGALRVSDLANTIATISLMEQLNVDDTKLPKQLAEYYSQLADDNRRLYDPNEDTGNIADTAEIIEQQMRNLRLTFFDAGTTQRDARAGSSLSGVSKTSSFSDNSTKKNLKNGVCNKSTSNNLEEIIDDSFAASVDFSSLNTAMNEEVVVEEEQATGKVVDLTEKMCQVFGSDINDETDDFSGFIVDEEQHSETQHAIANSSGEVLTMQPNALKKENSGQSTVSNTNVDSVAKNEVINSEIVSNTGSKSYETMANMESLKESSAELDFSAGSQGFNFGLPKLNPQTSTALPISKIPAQKSNKSNENFDVFTPLENQKKKFTSAPEAEQPLVDLSAPVIPTAAATLVKTEEDTKDLEDWLDSVLDD